MEQLALVTIIVSLVFTVGTLTVQQPESANFLAQTNVQVPSSVNHVIRSGSGVFRAHAPGERGVMARLVILPTE